MPHSGWQRFLVNDFKVNPPRPASLLIIDNIAHGCIGVGPPTAEILAAALVRAWGMSRSAKLVPFSRVGIVSLVFDLIPLGDRMNWAVNLRLAQSSHRFS